MPSRFRLWSISWNWRWRRSSAASRRGEIGLLLGLDLRVGAVGRPAVDEDDLLARRDVGLGVDNRKRRRCRSGSARRACPRPIDGAAACARRRGGPSRGRGAGGAGERHAGEDNAPPLRAPAPRPPSGGRARIDPIRRQAPGDAAAVLARGRIAGPVPRRRVAGAAAQYPAGRAVERRIAARPGDRTAGHPAVRADRQREARRALGFGADRRGRIIVGREIGAEIGASALRRHGSRHRRRRSGSPAPAAARDRAAAAVAAA